LLLAAGIGAATLGIRVGIVVVVVLLEYRCFVPGAAPNSIVDAHYVTQLIEVLENVNAYASVESSRFEKPQILLVVAARTYLVGRLHRLFLL